MADISDIQQLKQYVRDLKENVNITRREKENIKKNQMEFLEQTLYYIWKEKK